MKKLLEFMIKGIVSQPDKVVISEKKDDDTINLMVNVSPEDKKIVIGKNGRTINAIRNLLKIRAIKKKQRASLQLEE